MYRYYSRYQLSTSGSIRVLFAEHLQTHRAELAPPPPGGGPPKRFAYCYLGGRGVCKVVIRFGLRQSRHSEQFSFSQRMSAFALFSLYQMDHN